MCRLHQVKQWFLFTEMHGLPPFSVLQTTVRSTLTPYWGLAMAKAASFRVRSQIKRAHTRKSNGLYSLSCVAMASPPPPTLPTGLLFGNRDQTAPRTTLPERSTAPVCSVSRIMTFHLFSSRKQDGMYHSRNHKSGKNRTTPAEQTQTKNT